ncbi:hypothetical protein SteCoe_28121 [Stentor coeruleus]|uniref:Uncharacterized protein n=1 Tax=Stentor coeruleus TaxID=5963 RepID=A0A1R2B8Z5_9CILI|nr:hypothetical protein SteCoe_28121 [Stentor coeruleus]
MDSGTEKLEIHLEYPVSIETILSMSFNIEGFKSVFEFIIDILRRHEGLLGKSHENEIMNKHLTDEMKDLKARFGSLDDLIKALQESHVRLDKRVTVLEEEKEVRAIFEQNATENIAKLQSDVRENQDQISAHDTTLNEVLEKISRLEDQNELRGKFEKNTTESIERLENDVKDNKEQVAAHELSLAELLEKISKIEDEVGKSLRLLDGFKQEMEDMSSKLERNKKLVVETKEKVDSQGGKIIDHEKRIHELELDMQQALKAINSLGGEVEQISKPVETVMQVQEIVVDNTRVDMLNDDLNKLSSLLKDLDLRVRETEDGLGKTKTVADRADVLSKNLENEFKKLMEALRRLESSNRSEADSRVNTGSGVSNDELDHLRRALKSLEDMVKGKLSGEYASKDDFKNLNNQLKDLDAKFRAMEDILNKTRAMAERADAMSKILENELKKGNDSQRRSEPVHRPEPENRNRSSAPGASHEELDQLRKMLRALEEAMKGKMSIEDMQKMYNELKARADDHGSRLTALEFSIKQRVLRSELDDLLKGHEGGGGKQLAKIDDSIDPSKLTSLSRRVGTLEEHMKFLILPEGFDLLMVTNILLKVQQETKDHKEKGEKNYKDLWNKIREFEESLNKKAGLDKLKELEEMLLQKLRDLADEFSKRFAEKTETKRALKFLEKLIKETESIKIVRDGEDAMLARKPLGGWSCASCQKDLEKLMGKIAPYQPWNKLPYRDPADRIARAGPGFSRMLATVQPEFLTSRNKHTPYNATITSNIDEETSEGRNAFPPVKKQGEWPFTSL